MDDHDPLVWAIPAAAIIVLAVITASIWGSPDKVVEVRGSMTVVSASGSSYQARILVAPSESQPSWVVYTTDDRKIVLTGAPTVVIDSETVQRFGEAKKEEPTDG